MAVIKELHDSIIWDYEEDRERIEKNYVVETNDPDVAMSHGASIGASYPGRPWVRLVRKRAKVFSGSSYNQCLLQDIYEKNPKNEGSVEDDAEVTFDTSAQQVQISRALDDFYGGDGSPIGTELEGVSVYRPTFTLGFTYFWETITDAYLTTLYTATGTINANAWKIYPARCLLFLGAQGRRTGTEKWRVAYLFLFSPRKQVRDGTGAWQWVDGWDYVWNEWTMDIVSGQRIYVQGDNHVAVVYPESNFTLLGIGA